VAIQDVWPEKLRYRGDMGNSSVALRIEGGVLLDVRTPARARELSEFFGFAPRRSEEESYEQFSDCSLFDIYLGSYVKDWPRQAGSPPHPGLFADCFDVLLRSVVGKDAVLTLFIKSLDPGYFDELNFIKDYLIKERGRFLLFSHQEKDEKYPLQRVPDLFFEWSYNRAAFMVTEWFMSPQINIEGYVSVKPILPEISLWSSLASDPRTPRELLDSLNMAFRLWPDFNGMSILTNKMSSEDLVRRLDSEDLHRCIQVSLGPEQASP
jgi:hypothetical protein